MLLTYTDIQAALNIDLTEPNGQALATSLIAAATAFVATYIGYPLESIAQINYFNGELNPLWLPTGAPVSSLVIATFNTITLAYDDIDAQYIRNYGDSRVYVSIGLPCGFQSVRASYTTGWTSGNLPVDLKQALIDLVGIKIQEVANYSSDPSATDSSTEDDSGAITGQLKKVQAGSYTEEYAATGSEAMWKAKAAQLSRSIGDSIPAGIQEVLDRYRQPFAL